MVARENGSTPDGCVAAHIALERADHALQRSNAAHDGYRTVYEALGNMSQRIAALEGATRDGFRQMGVRLRKAEHVVDELEDTGVRNLRAELAKAQRGETWAQRRLLGAILGGIIGIIAAIIIALLKAHK